MSALVTEALPLVPGFHDDDDDQDNKRLIVGIKLKCVDGQWSAADGSELKRETHYLVRGTVTAAQKWEGNIPVETVIKEPGKPFPDVDELNKKIPQDTWEKGIDGKPREPWQITRVLYLIRSPDGKLFTYLNSTFGAKIAIGNLRDQVLVMRGIRGAEVVPIVGLSSAPMKTAFGQKIRPDFIVIGWRELASPQQPMIEAKAVEIGKPAEPVTLKEELDDEIPWLG
jgi:hypothetical protein